VELEQRRQLAAGLLLMLAVEAVDGLVVLRLHRVGVAEQAEQILILLMAPLTQAVVAVELMAEMLKTAAPASSSSSTTSALPQSSPSSHRRSGLHQRVR
jgi:hypothetical protein